MAILPPVQMDHLGGGVRALLRIPTALFAFALLALSGWLAPAALAGSAADSPLQIYGLTLDETRLGDGFCEMNGPADFIRQECTESRQSLPKITGIEVETTPAPYVMLTLAPDAAGNARDVRIWYSPRELGGRSFMIATERHSDQRLDGARAEVLAAFGPPTVEFTHADMEARGIHVADRTVDTLIYVDHDLPAAQWNRVAYRLRSEFNPSGAELFGLTNSTLRTLARLLGGDFRGAIVQISEYGWSHESTVTTMLLDLGRARSVFRLDG